MIFPLLLLILPCMGHPTGDILVRLSTNLRSQWLEFISAKRNFTEIICWSFSFHQVPPQARSAELSHGSDNTDIDGVLLGRLSITVSGPGKAVHRTRTDSSSSCMSRPICDWAMVGRSAQSGKPPPSTASTDWAGNV